MAQRRRATRARARPEGVPGVLSQPTPTEPRTGHPCPGTAGNVWCGLDVWRCRVCGSELLACEWDGDRFRLWNEEHERCR